MNSDFAGSSSNDDRRRRRLLSEQMVSEENAAVVFSPGQIASSRNHRYPVKRLIHYRAWKTWVTSFCLLALGGGLLYAAWADLQFDLGPGFSIVFNAETGTAFPMVCAGLLFLSGQLSWLIGWARSRSLTDFRGRFRVWRYIGLFLFLGSIGILIEADRVLNESLAFAGVQTPWTVDAYNWMIPTGTIALILFWCARREMQTSRLGRAHLWFSSLILLSGLGLPLVEQVELPFLAEKGLILGGLIGLMISLVWFARHVFYFSAEPVVASSHPGLLTRLFGSARRKQKREAGEQEQLEEAGSDHSNAKPASSPQDSPAPKRRRGSRRNTVANESVSANENNTAPTSKDKAAIPPAREQSAVEDANDAPPIVKLDPAELCVSDVDEQILRERIAMMELLAEEGEELDLEILKGLTKKQKKRLRNYWRELERYYQRRIAG